MKNFFEKIVNRLLLEAGNMAATNNRVLSLVSKGDPSKGFYIYHCAPKDAIDSISLSGQRRQYTGKNGGNLYGPGIYTTYTLDASIYNAEEDIGGNGWGNPHVLGSLKVGNVVDTNRGQVFDINGQVVNNYHSKKYGPVIVKLICKEDPRNMLIFDKAVVQQVYGRMLTPSEQLFSILRRHKNTDVLQNLCNMYMQKRYYIDSKDYSLKEIIDYNFDYKDGKNDEHYTRPSALPAWNHLLGPLKSKGITKYIRGIIFSGGSDGNVCVPYSFASSHPVGFSYDVGKTFKKVDTTNYIYNSIANNLDLANEFGDIYASFRTEGFSNGYAVAENNMGQCRILCQRLYAKNMRGDGRISDLWFDDVYGISFDECKPRKVKVSYRGNMYYLRRVPFHDDQYQVYDETNMHYLCDLNDLEKFTRDLQNQNYIQSQQNNQPQQQTQQGSDLDFSDLENMIL